MSRLSCLIPAVALVLAFAAPGPAQDDRLDRQEPELSVEAGGRTGTCDELVFGDDGKLLFAAGDDKVVRLWPNGPDGLDPSGMRTLRWPAWREQRGGIKALAVSPDAGRVLVGGFGMFGPFQVSVFLLDVATGQVVAQTFPPQDAGRRYYSVMVAAFRPDGKQAAFGTADGSIWVWDLAGPPRLVGRHPPTGKPGEGEVFNRPRLIFYRNDKLISVAQGGEVREDDPAGRAPGTVLATVHDDRSEVHLVPGARVYRAVVTPDRSWLAIGANGPAITLLNLETRAAKVLRLETGEFPRSLAFSRKGEWLAVGVGSLKQRGLPYHLEADHRIDLYADPRTADAPKPTAGPPHRGRAEAMAFDPDGRLAVAGGDDHEVTLWKLGDAPKSVSVVRGVGRGLWAVRVSTTGQAIGFRPTRDRAAVDPNAQGRGPWVMFDLQRGKPLRAGTADPDWVEPIATADGWRVVPSRESKFVWTVVRNVGGRDLPALTLPLDPDRDQAPQCYTFLPAKGDRPTRLVVGHYYGCSVFELTDGRVKKLMRCVGHAGEVASVAPGPTLDWFVSCGTDQTVAGWSLADWPTRTATGATFARKGGKLLVQKVDVGGPAWEMGLVEGDEIVLVGFGTDPPLFNVTGNDKVYGPRKELTDAAVEALRKADASKLVYLAWQRPGQGTIERLSTLPRRPLWKLFPAFDREDRLTDWVVWMWKTGNYDCSTHGDELIGWHLNDVEMAGTPRFFRAAQFRDALHTPLVVRPLLTDRDYPAALERALGENPQPISFGSLEPAPLKVAAVNPGARGTEVKVQVTVRQRGANPDLMPARVELWINDWRYKTWGAQPGGLDESVAIPVDRLRAGENVVTVQTVNRLGGRGEAQTAVRNPKQPGKPRLLGVAIGINDYTGVANNPAGARLFGNLKSAKQDAESLRDRLHTFSGQNKYFTDGDVKVLPDARAGRAAILAALDDLARRSGPDDRVVIFLAGHGDFIEKAGEKAKGKGVFVFCCPDYDRKTYNQTGVTAAELFDRLAAIPGRKLVLLDACHSGQAAEANMIRALVPTGQGPTVMAACDQNELSYEHPKFGNGLFTYAVLEALGDRFGDADANGDNQLGLDEINDYVLRRIPELLKQIGKPADVQNPICFPRQPAPFEFVKRVKE